MCRDHTQYPAFAPSTSEMAVCFWPVCIRLLIIVPTWPCVQVFLVAYSFFMSCCLRRLCPGTALCLFPLCGILQPFLRVKGPKVSSSGGTSCWTGAADPAPLEKCGSLLLHVPRTSRDLGHPPWEWIEVLEPSGALPEDVRAWKTHTWPKG